VVTPISDYYNLYEFLRILAAFLAFYADFPMPLLHTFRFTFACESRGVNGVVIIGTGGNILDNVKVRSLTVHWREHFGQSQGKVTGGNILDKVKVRSLEGTFWTKSR
jgi:hypothetical protein